MGLHLSAVVAKLHDRLDEAARAGADVILDRSQELVPVEGRPDTHGGTLAESGRVVTAGDVNVPGLAAITYDGPYAAYQHEGIEFAHPHGGQAKFLETALNEQAEQAVEKAGDAIRRLLES